MSDIVDQDGLSLIDLPPAVLHNNVLACLNPISLLRLGACSKQLQTIVSTSAVWELLCSEQGLTRQPFKDSYCAWRRTLCVECQQPTRYCFKLLGVRLCMACEHKHPRYGLVTEEEARERYCLSDDVLAELESVTSCGLELYLRSAVEAVAHPGLRTQQPAGGSVEEGESDQELLEGEEDDKAAGEAGEENGVGQQQEEEEEEGLVAGAMSGCEGEEESVVAAAAAARAAKKAERKAARKAAREVAEARQQLKAAARAQAQSQTGSNRGGGSGGGRQAGGKKQRHRAEARGRGARGRGQGEEWPLEGCVLGTSPKMRSASAWLAERQAVMAEFGEYALSGLVLTDA